MKDFHLVQCGIYNTENFYSTRKKGKERVCSLFELEYYISCTGHAFLDGRDYPLSADTILLGKPGRRRCSIPHFLCYYLHFEIDPENKYNRYLTEAPDYFCHIHAEQYKEIFRAIVRHVLRDENNRTSDYTYAKMLELFYLLLEDAPRNLAATQPDKPRNVNLLSEVVDFLHAHLQESITLSRLSQEFRYSPNYIQHLFTRTMGRTPRQYLQQIRLEQAKLLLTEQRLPLSDIALACGFCSQSYFSACFRHAFGVTPGQWQQQTNKDPFFVP